MRYLGRMDGGQSFDHHRRRFYEKFPHGRLLDDALRTQSNQTPLFYFSPSTDGDLHECWWVLGRLGRQLERQFSITSEVLFLFTPYNDLQRRSFNALTERVPAEVERQQVKAQGSARFTPDPNVFMLAAPDPQASEKLDAWNLSSSGAIVAALPATSAGLGANEYRERVAESLFSVLSSRDLYRGRNPVTGNEFFGRQDILQQLRMELLEGRSVGIFGLRRSGKTSVIREFKRRNSNQNVVVVISDLESIGALSEVPQQFSADVTNSLRELKEVDSGIWIGPESDQIARSFADLSSRIVRVAEKNHDYRFVISIDEVESLLPFVRDSEQALEVRHLLGALRRAAQTADNVALLLTGVTTRFFSEAMLDPAGRVDNPLLGFVEELFLRPFKQEETNSLVAKLGKGMMLQWEEEALRLLHARAGGFPVLVRDLASATRRLALDPGGRSVGTTEIEIGLDLVTRAFTSWRESAAGLWREIVRNLEAHHPLMAEILSCSADVEVAEWIRSGADGHMAGHALELLGMIERDGDGWRRSPALASMQALGASTVDGHDADALRVERRRRDEEAALVRSLAGKPEDETLERKESARVSVRSAAPDEGVMSAFAKAVAGFLNARGGTLLIGVDDHGGVRGIDPDLRVSEGSRDRYELFLRDKLSATLTGSLPDLKIRFLSADGKTVCLVSIPESDGPVWCIEKGTEVFYVRRGNQTVKMRNSEVVDYVAERWLSRER